MLSWTRRGRAKKLREPDIPTVKPPPTLPPELHHLIIQLSLPPPLFGAQGRGRMSLLGEYCLVSRDWRAYAQGELFKHLIVSTGKQCTKLVDVLTDTGGQASSSSTMSSIRADKLCKMVKTLRLGGTLSWGFEWKVIVKQRPSLVRSLFQLLTELEELRISSINDYVIQLQDLNNAKKLHTLFLRNAEFAISPTTYLPTLSRIGIFDRCLHGFTSEPEKYGHLDQERAVYHSLLSGIAPNLSIYARFPEPDCTHVEWPRNGEEPVGARDGNNVLQKAVWKDSGKRVIVADRVRRFEWYEGKVLPSRIGWYTLPQSRHDFDKEARSSWSGLTILCFKAASYKLYPTYLKCLSDALDDYLPLFETDEVLSNPLSLLEEIRIPSFETMKIPEREIQLERQADEIHSLRRVCNLGSRHVRVVVDAALAVGEYDYQGIMEHGAFYEFFWSGVRSLQFREY